MKINILLVEDSTVDRALIQPILQSMANVLVATTLAEAKNFLRVEDIDMILLDVELPDGNGFDFFAQLRVEKNTKRIPVIFLTYKKETHDEVMGFSLGAEDYIFKPVDHIRVRARIEAKIGRIIGSRSQESLIQKAGLRIDLAAQRVFILAEGFEARLVDLTPLEFKVLVHFVRHEDQVFSREQLIESVWGNNLNIVDRTVDMHVCNLRKKISGGRCSLDSVHGVGYRFCVR